MEIWILITIAAAFLQNIRSGLQKHLRGKMGTAGATFVRFVFGIPFAFVFLIFAVIATGGELPALNNHFIIWVILGAIAQIIAQALLIILFTYRNFAVGSAYIRMEPILAAVFGFVLLAELPDWSVVLSVTLSVIGVVMVTMARSKENIWSLFVVFMKPEAQFGLASAAIFGLAAVAYRGASLSLEGPNFLVQGGVTLCVAIILQSILVTGWIFFKDRSDFTNIAATWKTGLSVGFFGALASFGWFTAMTLQQASAVKAVAQIEIIFAFATSWFFFKEQMNRNEIIGSLLIVSGVILLIFLS